MHFMMDGHFCISLIRKQPGGVLEKIQKQRAGDLGISSLTVAQLAFYAMNSRHPEQNMDALQSFLIPLAIASFDHRAAFRYGQLQVLLKKRKKSMDTAHALIAAHAVSLSAVLVTTRAAEYKKVPSLAVENWLQVR